MSPPEFLYKLRKRNPSLVPPYLPQPPLRSLSDIRAFAKHLGYPFPIPWWSPIPLYLTHMWEWLEATIPPDYKRFHLVIHRRR